MHRHMDIKDEYTFMITSRSILLTMRNISDKSCSENQNTNTMFSKFFSENLTVHEIMWKSVMSRQAKGERNTVSDS